MISTQRDNAVTERLKQDRQMCECGHKGAEHVTHRSGAFMCKHFGCGCRDFERAKETITAYSLAWRTSHMRVAGFWYYRTEAEANKVAASMRPECETKVREVQVRADFEGWA